MDSYFNNFPNNPYNRTPTGRNPYGRNSYFDQNAPTSFLNFNYFKPPFDDRDLSHPGRFNKRNKVKIVSILLIFLGGSFFSYLLWSYLLVTYSVNATDRVKNPSYLVESANLQVAAGEIDPRKVLSEQVTPSPTAAPISSFFKVAIPSINLSDALVSTNVTSDKQEVYFPILEKSAAHYQGSALPGERGNVFVYGHSVLPQFFKPNDYLTIFSNLYKVRPDDSIYLKMSNHVYEYKVTAKKIVDPRDLKAANIDNRSTSTLTLMTCYPPGLTSQRLLVYADIVSE